MYYGKRKKKTEPEKAYAELVFFLMLKSGFGVSIHDLEKVMKRSIKTYQRYASELLDTGEIDYIEYRPHDSVPTFASQPLYSEKESCSVISGNASNTSSSHINRLKRLISLIKTIEAIPPRESGLIYPDDYSYFDIASHIKYNDYENSVGSFPIRTFQRDKQIVLKAIAYYEQVFLQMNSFD